MSDKPLPQRVARTTPTPLPAHHRDTRSMVRRARLEHLATELLRLGNALRPPVPVEELYAQPPYRLWPTEPGDPLMRPAANPGVEDRPQRRLDIARAIAERVSTSSWPLRIQLLGPHPLALAEIELFALALLLPTGLLSGINEHQRTPSAIATIFQTPLKESTLRLGELGYLTPQAEQRATGDTTD